jgi:hypothetical protein
VNSVRFSSFTRDSSLFTASILDLMHTHSRMQCVQSFLYKGLRRSEREADHLHLSHTEFKNVSLAVLFYTRLREVLGSDLGRDAGVSWFSSASSDKFRDSFSVRAWSRPSKSFPIHQSCIICPSTLYSPGTDSAVKEYIELQHHFRILVVRVLVSDLGQDTGYRDEGFLWISLVRPGKCWDRTSI